MLSKDVVVLSMGEGRGGGWRGVEGRVWRVGGFGDGVKWWGRGGMTAQGRDVLCKSAHVAVTRFVANTCSKPLAAPFFLPRVLRAATKTPLPCILLLGLYSLSHFVRFETPHQQQTSKPDRFSRFSASFWGDE